MRNTSTATPKAGDRQPGGRTTTTGSGVAHVAPGSDGGGIQPELLTSKQASELCGISERTLWGWSRSGIAPKPIHIGHGLRPMVRFRRSDLVEWIGNGCPRVDGKGGAQ